ncbi:MAG: hypothetical protein WBL61_20305 [Bryobacteraceae bacterium]
MLRPVLITLILVLLGLPSLALADQLATWAEINAENNDFSLTDNGSSETFTGTSDITFIFSSALGITVPGQAVDGAVDAIMTLSVTTTSNVGQLGSLDVQAGFHGSFTITDDVPGVDYGDNLLSGTFASDAEISGTDGGYSMGFTDSDTKTLPPNEVVFSSAFVNFNYYTESDSVNFSFTNLIPALALDVSDKFLASNTSAGSGTFSATPLPPPFTAEPHTMVLIGAGLVGLGVVLRKRKLQPVL